MHRDCIECNQIGLFNQRALTHTLTHPDKKKTKNNGHGFVSIFLSLLPAMPLFFLIFHWIKPAKVCVGVCNTNLQPWALSLVFCSPSLSGLHCSPLPHRHSHTGLINLPCNNKLPQFDIEIREETHRERERKSEKCQEGRKVNEKNCFLLGRPWNAYLASGFMRRTNFKITGSRRNLYDQMFAINFRFRLKYVAIVDYYMYICT